MITFVALSRMQNSGGGGRRRLINPPQGMTNNLIHAKFSDRMVRAYSVEKKWFEGMDEIKEGKKIREVLRDITNTNVPNQVRILYAYWVFMICAKMIIRNKLFTPIEDDEKKNMTNEESETRRKEYEIKVIDEIETVHRKCNNLLLKTKYLTYIDSDTLIEVCYRFFKKRYNNDKLFTLQVLNDQCLTNSEAYWKEVKEHFFEWIDKLKAERDKVRTRPESEAREHELLIYKKKLSNLLDVVLRYYAGDKRTRDFHIEMSFEESSSHTKKPNINAKTVYADQQNAHNNDYIELAKLYGNKLIDMYKNSPVETKKDDYEMVPLDDSDLYDTIQTLYDAGFDADEFRDVFERIEIDNTRFNGYTISELLVAVVKHIKNNQYSDTLFQRLKEEMREMDGYCSSGYIVRLINVFQGFDEELSLKLSFEKQLFAVITNMIAKSEMSDDVIAGTYEAQHKEKYIKHVLKLVNDNLSYLQKTYGYNDIKNNIVPVCQKITETAGWQYKSGWFGSDSVDFESIR